MAKGVMAARVAKARAGAGSVSAEQKAAEVTLILSGVTGIISLWLWWRARKMRRG